MPASVSVESLSVVDLTMEEENLKLGLCGLASLTLPDMLIWATLKKMMQKSVVDCAEKI
jgi:hypothetical protein